MDKIVKSGNPGKNPLAMAPSNKITAMPKSGNAELGIDAATAAGSGEGEGGRAASNLKGNLGLNTGMDGGSSKGFMNDYTDTKDSARTPSSGASAKRGSVQKASQPNLASRPDGDGSGGGNKGSMAMARAAYRGKSTD